MSNLSEQRNDINGYNEILNDISANIIDVIEQIAAENNILIYDKNNEEDKIEVENSDIIGIYGEIYYTIESKVEDLLEDMLVKLNNKNLIQGIIFEEEKKDE